MKIVQRSLVVSLFLVIALSIVAVAQEYNYTLTPWQYGVVAWVQTPPENVQDVIDRAGQAVEDVFSFWGQGIPTTSGDQQGLTPMSIDQWNLCGHNAFTAGFVPVPSPTSQDVWAVPTLFWKGMQELPLILIAFPSADDLHNLLEGGYIRAQFSMGNPFLTWAISGSDPSLASLINRSSCITFDYNDQHLSFTLHHEFGHFLMRSLYQRVGATEAFLPPLIDEGFSQYTAYGLSKNDDWRYSNLNWRIIAAAWTQSHGLSHVPFHMLYQVGPSLISFLVERDGIDGFIADLHDILDPSQGFLSSVSPSWREWASAFPLTDAEEAYAIEQMQFYLCEYVASPFMSKDTWRQVDRLRSLEASTDDIISFWQSLCQPVPRPSNSVLKDLQERIGDVIWLVRVSKNTKLAQELADDERELETLNADWSSYHALLVSMLRKIVAHYDDY